MTPSVLQSVDAVAAAARLRDALVDEHRVLPEIARPLARAVAAQRSCFDKFRLLYTQSSLGPYTCVRVLKACGMFPGDGR